MIKPYRNLLACGLLTLAAVCHAQGAPSPARLEQLRAAVAQTPADASAHLRLAAALATTPEGIAEAVAEYRAALALEPNNYAARKGLAQTLPLDGNTPEITSLYDGLLAEQPNDVDALLARAQLARFAGDQKLASELLEKALALAPADARLLAEKSLLSLAADDKTEASKAAAVATAIEPALPAAQQAKQAVSEATAASFSSKLGYTEDSADFAYTAVSARAEWYPLADTRLRIEPGYSRYRDPVDALNRPNIGAALRQTFAHGISASTTYRAYFPEGVDETHELDGELGWRPFELPLLFAAGLRRRALIDIPSGYEDLADFGRVGSGGSTVASIRQRLQVNEKVFGMTAMPLEGSYLYAEGSRGKLSDGNRRKSIVAGFGYDLFRGVEGYSKQTLLLKYDFQDETFRTPSGIYFSNPKFQLHTPGVDWRYRFNERSTLGLEGGFPIQSNGDTGFVLGGFVSSKITPQLMLEGRARVVDDTQFRVVSVVLGPRYSF